MLCHPTQVAAVASLAADMGLSCIQPMVADATQRYQQGGKRHSAEVQLPVNEEYEAMLQDDGDHKTLSSSSSSRRHADQQLPEHEACSPQRLSLEPESFDYILLDAPCSALGLRPRLLMNWSMQQLINIAAYQRALLHSAVYLLKPGGYLVYCTCTINPGE